MELHSRSTRRGEFGFIPPEMHQNHALRNALSLPQPAAQVWQREFAGKSFTSASPSNVGKGFDQSINSLIFPLATQSSRGRSPLLTSDGWNILGHLCFPNTGGKGKLKAGFHTLGTPCSDFHVHLLPPGRTLLPHLCSQMLDSSNSRC